MASHFAAPPPHCLQAVALLVLIGLGLLLHSRISDAQVRGPNHNTAPLVGLMWGCFASEKFTNVQPPLGCRSRATGTCM